MSLPVELRRLNKAEVLNMAEGANKAEDPPKEDTLLSFPPLPFYYLIDEAF